VPARLRESAITMPRRLSPLRRRPSAGSLRVAPSLDGARRLRRGRLAIEHRAGRLRVALAVAVLALVGTNPAHGQTATAEIVPARVYAGWLVYRNYTRVDQLVLWNAQPGARVGLFCVTRDLRDRERPCVLPSGRRTR
jgi:hypothetical protein